MLPRTRPAALRWVILCSSWAATCLAQGGLAQGIQWRCDVPSKPNKVVDPSVVLAWDGTNPYCLSLDGKRCWADPRSSCQAKIQQQQLLLSAKPAGMKPPQQQQQQQLAKPLVCGKALKAATGVSGYEDSRHWCSIARSFLDQPAILCLKQGKGMFSYSKKACVAGKAGGAVCSKHADCASNSCIFSCSFKPGRCAYCKQDSDCPGGSKCWVTVADASDRWAAALPMCGLTCDPAIGHVCACGESTSRGNPRPCPDGYYCTRPSFGDGCGPQPDTSSATSCVKKTRDRFASSCEDIEGNVMPDAGCEGPQGQTGLCLQSPDKRGLLWADLDYSNVYRRCTHRCSSNADCPPSAASAAWRATDYAHLQLCDTLKLTHPGFPTCLVGLKGPPPALHQICSTKGGLACATWKGRSLTVGISPAGPLPTACAVPERLLQQQGPAAGARPRLEYGKCMALCPGLQLGASCRALLPGGDVDNSFDSEGQYLATLVCREVRLVTGKDGPGETVKACVQDG